MRHIKLLLATILTMLVMTGFVYGQDTTLTVINGNVGIGTTSPVATLHVEFGGGFGSPQIQINQTRAGDFTRLRFQNPSGQFWDIAESPGNQLRFFTGSGFGDVMTLTSNGRVGIGTSDPGSRLDVIADGATKIDLRTTSTTAAIFQRFFHSTNIQGGTIGFDTNENVFKVVHGGNFETSTNGLAISSGGKVGIGTSDPRSRLDVIANGATKIDLRTSSTTEPIFLRFFHSTDIQGGAIGFDTNDNVLKLVYGGNFAASTNGLAISSDGNVGIGTMAPTQPLEMASGAHVTLGGVWTDASSRQYKENISNLTPEEAFAALEKLNPVKFNYKVEKDEEYVGFIAEDVPELVATKARQSLSPMDIVAVLTKVVQQQQKRIAELEARLNASQ